MSTGKKLNLATAAEWSALSLVVGQLLFWSIPDVFQTWNLKTLDALYVFRSRQQGLAPPYDPVIVQVDLTFQTVDLLRKDYFTRADYARGISNLAAMGAALQVWDMYLPAPTVENEDLAIIDAAKQARNVLFGMSFMSFGARGTASAASTGEDVHLMDHNHWRVAMHGTADGFIQAARPRPTFPALASAAAGLGYLNIKADSDGTHRRLPLLARCGDATYPSLALRAACAWLRVAPTHVVVKPGKSITLRAAQRPGRAPGDIVIPIDAGGNMLVNFVASLDTIPHVDFEKVFLASDFRADRDLLREELAGKIILIADLRAGVADIGPVPGDEAYPLACFQANAIHTIVSGNFLRELPGWQMFLLEALLLGVVAGWSVRFASLSFTLGTAILIVGYLVGGGLLFLHAGTIANLLRPVMEMAMAFTVLMVSRYLDEEKERAVIRRSFEAYFPPAVVRKIVNNPSMVTLGGQRKELTILFSDIRSFTTHSANLSPDQVQRLLNEYFDAMVEIVFRYEGTVDKIMGDGLLVFFGDPEPQADHAVRCVRTAVEMQKLSRALDAHWRDEGKMPLQVRIGINTGPVVVGNMGSARRLSYTVIGAAVNLAQRLEANAPPEGILISQRTWELINSQFDTRPLGPIPVKGLAEQVEVYEVMWGKSEKAPLLA